MGLVNRVVAPDELDEAAFGWATELAAGPLDAMAIAKRVIDDGLDGDLDRGLEHRAGRVRRGVRHRRRHRRCPLVPRARPGQRHVPLTFQVEASSVQVRSLRSLLHYGTSTGPPAADEAG